MDNEFKEKALEDVKFIKEVILKTSTSILELSSFFLKCSFLFFAVIILFIWGGSIPIKGIDISDNSIPTLFY